MSFNAIVLHLPVFLYIYPILKRKKHGGSTTQATVEQNTGFTLFSQWRAFSVFSCCMKKKNLRKKKFTYHSFPHKMFIKSVHLFINKMVTIFFKAR